MPYTSPNPDEAIKSFSRQLKPGGTLAIAAFGIISLSNVEAESIMKEITEVRIDSLLKETSRKGIDVLPTFRLTKSPYDNVEVASTDYHPVKRIRLNDQKINEFDRGTKFMRKLNFKSKVGSDDEIVKEVDHDWFFKKTLEDINDHLVTFPDDIDHFVIDPLLERLEATLENGLLKGYCPVRIILATRR